jgi:Ni,Fe-hydrogenase III component G
VHKKKVLSYSLWWLDANILSVSSLKFKYSYNSNNFIINVNKNFLYYFFLVNKKNISTLNFYILDIFSFKNNISNNNYYICYQSLFYDFKILMETQIFNNVASISKIYNGSLWSEREVKEFNKLNYSNLTDTRKLLSNYNYNEELNYNNFNNILNDIKI